ncbi:MAG TPA: methyltransferase domain-containing protein [Candidatus Dormibacteraeota bacterium]|jgi:SAM-dependent methyltransferase|nr:methyltransferase domain-containing protein [Candidatus Dormibacteraeota bacterium]
MNLMHRRYCRSDRWARTVGGSVIGPVLDGLDLGDDVLEVGPGPGRTTDVLRQRVPRLTSLEIDAQLAATLADRLRGTNVEVVHGDGTAMPFATGRYTAAVCFTMLHHVPTPQLQDRLLAEMCRVLRPGGLLAGSDSAGGTLLFRALHIGDTMVVVDPGAFPARLRRAGFEHVSVERTAGRVRFRGVRPAA